MQARTWIGFATALSLFLCCAFVSPKDGEPTYAADIRPLIAEKCLSCHVEGGMAPFPLQSFEQVKKRARLVWTMALSLKMPVCNASSDAGEFCIGGPFTDEQLVLFQRWLAAGAPEGVATEPLPSPGKEWRLGAPDAVLRPVEAAPIEPEGRPFWRTFVLDLKPYKGKRIRAFDVRVESPQVLRQATLGFAPDGLAGANRGRAGFPTYGTLSHYTSRVFGSWAPGYPVWQFPRGASLPIAADGLAVQAFYLQRGRTEPGGFEVALYFSRDEGDREVKTVQTGSMDIQVSAGSTVELSYQHQFPGTVDLIAIVPEARFYCSDILVTAPGFRLLDTRKWEPYWVGVFRYREPIRLAAGSEVSARFTIENDIHASRNEVTVPRPVSGGYREAQEANYVNLVYCDAR
ncbi:MAG: hypothetical protein IT207_04715 [Fimbriimonadaceae bacterium]|nr:hypothetical protein [Fimbriimonadaceae bacterium]